MTALEAIGHMIYVKEIIRSEIPWTKAEEAVDVAIKALEKQHKYRWHDLRKNPDDLPAAEDADESVMYECVLENHVHDPSYPAFYYDDYRKAFGYRNSAYQIANGADDFETLEDMGYEKVIAWREKEPFEVTE